MSNVSREHEGQPGRARFNQRLSYLFYFVYTLYHLGTIGKSALRILIIIHRFADYFRYLLYGPGWTPVMADLVAGQMCQTIL